MQHSNHTFRIQGLRGIFWGILVLQLCILQIIRGNRLESLAFVSVDQLNTKEVQIIKNITVKNKSENEETKNCFYFRDWIAKYSFKNDKKKSIYYYVIQCLDQSFEVIKSSVKFNYDGGDERLMLPEGCISPIIPKDERMDPCKRGKALGKAILSDFVEMLGRKLLFHIKAVSDLESESIEGLSTDRLDEMVQRIPELVELIEQIQEEERKKPDLQPIKRDILRDGSKVDSFSLKNEQLATLTHEPSGKLTSKFKLIEGGIRTRVDNIDKTSEIVRKDAQGRVQWIMTIQPDIDDEAFEFVQLYSSERKAIGAPFRRLRTSAQIYDDVEISEEIYFAFSEAAEFYIKTIEEYVTERVKCFVKGIVPNKEDYLVYVCASLDSDFIKQEVLQKFQKLLVCKNKCFCDKIENRMLIQIKLYTEFGIINK